MTSFKKFLEEELRDPEFAQAYEQVSVEMDFALALARRRDELGLTQQALAERTGIKQPMIARIEHGQMPTAPTLQRLAKGLSLSITFTGDDIVLVRKVEKVKHKVRQKEESAEMYVKMAEIDYAYRNELDEPLSPYTGSKNEAVSFTARGILR
jgi:transcriptional regulator with XRE-family HTH domain